MSKKRYIHKLFLVFCAMIFYIPITVQAHDYESVDSYRILFLSSYSPSWETVPFQIEGAQNSLNPLLYTLEYEFMDVKNIKYNENYKEFYELLSYKLENTQPYDGIIVGDDAALNFVQIYQDKLFKDIPIVFQGIDDIDNAIKASSDPLITGVVEKSCYHKNLELAKSIQPDAEDLILIYDNTESGLGILEQIKKEKDLFTEYNVHFLNSSNYSRKEICNFFENFKNEYIVFLAIMGEEKNDKKLSNADAYHIINEHIKYPIFRFGNTGIGKGILGGYIVDHFESGKIAGEMMTAILEKNEVNDLVMDTPYLYIFDYKIIEKYKINESLLPKDAMFINKPQAFYEKYNKIIINSLMFGMGALIIGLYFNNLSKKRLEETNLKLLEVEKVLTHQNYHDDLTKLPNRKNIVEDLEHLFDNKIPHGLIIVDIDDFKEINLAHGNIYGDEILNVLSNRLLEYCKNRNIKISRFGGDEFLFLIKDEQLSQLNDYIAEIKNVFLKKIKIDNIEFFIQISLGIAIYDQELENSLDLLSNVTLALQEAKSDGKNTTVHYDDQMRDHFVDRKKVEDVLLHAIKTDGFKILYQPQVDMDGNVVGFEALLRLKNNEYYPGEFIPIAEGSDLILRIGRIVTKKVVKQLAEWRKKGLDLKPVSINFSNRQIRDENYVQYLRSLLDQYNICPNLIEIEITENVFINNDEKAKKLFSELLLNKISLSLDDFGTGYSSISYLTYLPVKKIKIDRSLVQIFINQNEGKFIGNIIELAHTLGLEITIEGVETRQEYERIKKLGADYIQGYYFSKPLKAVEIEEIKSILLPD